MRYRILEKGRKVGLGALERCDRAQGKETHVERNRGRKGGRSSDDQCPWERFTARLSAEGLQDEGGRGTDENSDCLKRITSEIGVPR
jgi:hypothetical protein